MKKSHAGKSEVFGDKKFWGRVRGNGTQVGNKSQQTATSAAWLAPLAVPVLREALALFAHGSLFKKPKGGVLEMLWIFGIWVAIFTPFTEPVEPDACHSYEDTDSEQNITWQEIGQ
jgi:hypothetical protein